MGIPVGSLSEYRLLNKKHKSVPEIKHIDLSAAEARQVGLAFGDASSSATQYNL